MKTVADAARDLTAAGAGAEVVGKWDALLRQIQACPAAIVAYSGGVDSSFLAYAAYLVLGEAMLAVTITSSAEAPSQIDAAVRFASEHGFQQRLLAYDPLQDARFRANPVDRCYICKTAILTRIWQYARERQIPVVFEGQNADDQGDYRPGRKAVAETGTRSPLAENGLTKAEIRTLARALGLAVWNHPASPCLATRIPYGVPITAQALRQIAQGEAFLHRKGFAGCRVRYHNDLARIEVAPEQIGQVISMREELAAYFKELGFHHVCVDLHGYRMGSLNEGIGS